MPKLNGCYFFYMEIFPPFNYNGDRKGMMRLKLSPPLSNPEALSTSAASNISYFYAFINPDWWIYIGLTGLFGLIGGIGFILLFGEYIKSYKVEFKDENGNITETTYIIGTIKEIFLGAIGGVLTSLLFYGGIELHHAIHIALITGFGATNYIKRYLEKHHQNMINEVQQLTTIQKVKNYNPPETGIDKGTGADKGNKHQ